MQEDQLKYTLYVTMKHILYTEPIEIQVFCTNLSLLREFATSKMGLTNKEFDKDLQKSRQKEVIQ